MLGEGNGIVSYGLQVAQSVIPLVRRLAARPGVSLSLCRD